MKPAEDAKIQPIRPDVMRIDDPRARQLLEFVGEMLIDSMVDGELPDGVVLVVFGKDGGVTPSADIQATRIPAAFATAASVCHEQCVDALRKGMGRGLDSAG